MMLLNVRLDMYDIYMAKCVISLLSTKCPVHFQFVVDGRTEEQKLACFCVRVLSNVSLQIILENIRSIDQFEYSTYYFNDNKQTKIFNVNCEWFFFISPCVSKLDFRESRRQ